MADGEGFPYLIPLIWQGDGPAASPNYQQRATLYGAASLPTGVWGGTLSFVGGGATVLSAYTQRYQTLVGQTALIEIDLDFTLSGNTLNVTADILGNIPPEELNNTRVVFIISYNRDEVQPGNYFASVSRYHEQVYTPTTSTYTQTIALDSSWDHRETKIVVMVQNFSGARRIFNARQKRLDDILPVGNLRSYTGSDQISIVWETPKSELDLLRYRVYRDGTLLHENLPTALFYADTDVLPATTYQYTIVPVYENDVSPATNPFLDASLHSEGIVQLGSGDLVNSTMEPAPINVYYRSLRGQSIYTAQELSWTGMVGPHDITSLGFFVEQAPAHPLPDFTIRIKHTSHSAPSSHDSGPWCIVHTIPGTNFSPVAGDWLMIALPTAFHWDGESNILIDTAFGQVPSWNASGRVRMIRSHNGYRFIRSDTGNMMHQVTNSVESYKPQMRFSVNYCENDVLSAPENAIVNHGEFTDYVVLSWDIPDYICSIRTVDSYRIYRNGIYIGTDSLAVRTAFDLDLMESGTYTYTVSAVYGSEESEQSSGAYIEIDLYCYPPRSLVANVINAQNHVRLVWGVPEVMTNRFTGFMVYRNGTPISANPVFTLTYTDNTINQSDDYVYHVTTLYPYGESEPSNKASVTVSEVDETLITRVNALSNNYPNPFNPTTTIYFEIAIASSVKIDVFNAKGQHITTLTDHYYETGRHYIVWDGKDALDNDMPSGVYIYQMNTGSFVETKKMILLK
jgi:hypothetical protein